MFTLQTNFSGLSESVVWPSPCFFQTTSSAAGFRVGHSINYCVYFFCSDVNV